MKNFTYCTPTRYVFGAGAENEAGKEAAAIGVKRVLTVYGGGSASIGLPVTFPELGVPQPDIDEMVRRLHINKGEAIGGYLTLRAEDTAEIYRLAL